MARRVVFIRHAKTEARREGLDDFERELTKAGLRSCEARLPLALSLLDHYDTGPISVWSSPARRALQTAEVAARALDASRIEAHESLYAADPEVFLSELAGFSGTVVAVGHNPLLEELYASFSGKPQELGKCAAASFALSGGPDERPEARLEWFVQGPDHTRWKTLVGIEKVVKRAGKRVRDKRVAFLSDPLDVEALHQYRISLRVARSLVQFLAPYLKEKRADAAQDALKQLARETSRLRELDVFAEQVAGRQARGVEEGALALKVELERNQARAGLMRSLQSGDDLRLLARVKRFCRELPWKRSVEMMGLSASELAGRLDALARECRDGLEACDFSDSEATHDLRKRSKRLRYAARELGGILGNVSQAEGRGAKEMQERLGEVCDARVNAALAREFGDESMAREQSELVLSLIGSM